MLLMRWLCLIMHRYAVRAVTLSPNLARAVVNYRCRRCGKEKRAAL